MKRRLQTTTSNNSTNGPSIYFRGLAYVDDQDAETISVQRVAWKWPGISPFRTRSVEENLELFRKMRDGDLDEALESSGEKTRQATRKHAVGPMYRIRNQPHIAGRPLAYRLRLGTRCWTQLKELLTTCTLEFDSHRPLRNQQGLEVTSRKRPRQNSPASNSPTPSPQNASAASRTALSMGGTTSTALRVGFVDGAIRLRPSRSSARTSVYLGNSRHQIELSNHLCGNISQRNGSTQDGCSQPAATCH